MFVKFFAKLFSGAKETAKDSPNLYDDLIHPSAQATGNLIAKLPQAINAALAPLDIWIATRNYNLESTKILLEQKLASVDPEKIVTPDSYVAVPALQALSYSMDSEDLRELYANLLAKAMNQDTKNDVHPSFVEVIKQLSPQDAAYFKHLYSLDVRPLIDIGVEYDDGSWQDIKPRYNLFSEGFPNFNLSIDNLSRLRLIDIPNGILYSDDDLYQSLIDHSISNGYTIERHRIIYPEIKEMHYTKLRLDRTDFGVKFYSICVRELP